MRASVRVKRPSVQVGQEFKTTHGLCKVVEYGGWDKITVEFLDGYQKTVQLSQLRSGNVRNPYYPTVSGVGFLGEGSQKASEGTGISSRAYRIWLSMIKRCYDRKTQDKQPSYKGCSVSKEWHNFQNFAKWFEENYIENFHLDKDLLVKGNKVYSPETCCFLPPELNSFLTRRDKLRGSLPIGVSKHKKKFSALYWDETGCKRSVDCPSAEEAFNVYKESKESRAKLLAVKYKDVINVSAFNALMNFEVLITE